MKMKQKLKWLGTINILLLITACSSSPDDVYIHSQGRSALEIPPDLSKPVISPEFEIPGISSQQTTYSSYTTTEQQAKQLLPELGKDVSFVRDGNVFWLELKMSPQKLWPIVQSFVGRAGFEIKYSNQLIGTIDTSWRENDEGASLLTKLTSGDQGTYMDKFRLRLERGDNKKTLLFIRHKGARIARDVFDVDKFTGTEKVDPVILSQDGAEKTIWISRPSDTDLEIEMLQNFMLYIGLNKNAVDNELSAYSNKKVARIVSSKQGPTLEVSENFPRTWRRIGLALDRMGFVVEDRNRSAGVYYISLPDKFETTEEKSWFENLFSKDSSDTPHDYLLSISGKGNETHVRLKNRSQKKLDDKVVKKILLQIQAHIS